MSDTITRHPEPSARSCDELGLCQGRSPACAGCDQAEEVGHIIRLITGARAPEVLWWHPRQPGLLQPWRGQGDGWVPFVAQSDDDGMSRWLRAALIAGLGAALLVLAAVGAGALIGWWRGA